MAVDFTQVEFDSGNPEPRCPCVLLLDTSGSMDGAPINELNAGLQAFHGALFKDELALLRIEIALITFGAGVQVTQDFIAADQFIPPVLAASGYTPMGEAINLALDKLDQRKQLYKSYGISYYRPWVFLITDGAPTDAWQSAAQRVQAAEQSKKVAFFSVGIQNADMQVLQRIASRAPMHLQGLSFRDLFVWLSTSLSSVSRSSPGELVALPSPQGWASV